MSESASDSFPFESRLLLVDDSPFSHERLTGELKKMGYKNIFNAKNAKEAQAFLQSSFEKARPVHLVISDIHMPNTSGLVFLRWLREQEHFVELPVILLTSSSEKSEILEGINLGISHYLLKPFSPPVLKEKLRLAWEKHGKSYYERFKG